MSRTDCDVAIVGGGIAGSALALALIRAGFDVRVIERGRAPAPFDAAQTDPRVYAISPGSAAFLDRLGVWPQIGCERAGPIRAMQIWDREPATALHFDAGDAGAEVLGWIVEHRALARSLWDALPADTIRAQVAVDTVAFADDAVELGLGDGRRLRASLAVGAEGADSRLREVAGIDTAGWSYASSAVVCHLESSTPHRGLALQRFLPSGPVALLPLADGRRSLVWSVPEAEARELLQLDDETFSGQLADAVQHAAGRLRAPTPRLSFPLRLLHASAYVAPRCALVGDSAHVVHPLAGQGLNLGLADAAQLAQELVAARDARRDWSSLRTLTRYERARRAENLEMLALTDALGRVFALDLPGWRRLLHLGLRAVDRLPPVKQILATRATGG